MLFFASNCPLWQLHWKIPRRDRGGIVLKFVNLTEINSLNSQDHFLLPDKSNTVKLPTYEDCIKADKYLAVDLKDTKDSEDMKEAADVIKTDLSLSFSVVLDDEEPLHK